MNFCLTKPTVQKIRKALKEREIDPIKLAGMTSIERNTFLSKYVGENAKDVNALFESKLLLKNQKAGYISWAKKVVGMSPQTKQDMISKIERMEKVLNPKEEEKFLHDLASSRLGFEVTQEQAKTVADLSTKMQELKTKISEDTPERSKERLEYGTVNAVLKEYISKQKYEAKRIFFKEQPARYVLNFAFNAIPNLSQSIRTAYDNSVWLRQMVGALTTPRYTKIWTKNFLKSWKDIGKELKGHDAMLPIKADIYSRPNALNGKYDADPNGYGLGVRSEEVYSSEWPAKIPVLGRLFKASESAFNGGALRMRADIADLEIKAAETLGINTLDKENAAAIGSMVTSITGRGSVGGAEGVLRKIFWAPRMYVAQINQITAHLFDPKATAYTRKQAAKNLLSRLAVYTLLFSLAKLVDKNSIDEKGHLGKIKIWGKWIDMTGGTASYLTLGMKITNKLITYMQGKQPKYGEASAMDDLLSFAEGKFSPTAGIIKDILSGKLYGGEPLTGIGMAKAYFTPISYQTWEQLSKDPTTSNIFGLILLEELGANVSSWLEGNQKTDIIPTDKVIKNTDFLSMLNVYMRAFAIDRETAWNRIFTGQRIIQISPGNIIVVARDENWDERKKEYAKKYHVSADQIKEVREEHLIPIKGGGADADNNRKMVSKTLWTEFTKVDNAYIAARKLGKISQKEGEKLIIEYKNSRISGSTKITQEDMLKKLK